MGRVVLWAVISLSQSGNQDGLRGTVKMGADVGHSPRGLPCITHDSLWLDDDGAGEMEMEVEVEVGGQGDAPCNDLVRIHWLTTSGNCLLRGARH